MRTRTASRQNLMTASREWASRPADQRFWNLQELLDRSKRYAEESVVAKVPLSDCLVQPYNGEDLALVGPKGQPATFQHYSFGQLAGLCKAPAAYLRELPAALASGCLNEGLKHVDGTQALMFHKNGGLQLRCVTSDEYTRIWNHQVASMALALQEQEGWVVPPARPCGLEGIPVRKATKDDVLRHSAHRSLGVHVGDDISPSGLYASDHDCFIFQVNEDCQIDAGGGEMLFRGVIWKNSEVGDAKFRGTMFLYDTICGNHIIWGAKIVAEIEIVHKGKADVLFREAMATATSRMVRSASEDEQRIQAAKVATLGTNREKVVDLVFKKQLGLSKTECDMAYTLAERHESDHGGDPTTCWGYAAGVTRLSQSQYGDSRERMDRAAGKILSIAF